MFFRRRVSFFRRPQTQYWMAGATAVLLGLTAGLVSRGTVLQGNLHELSETPKDFALTEIGVDEAGYVYGAITNYSEHDLEIELSYSLEDNFMASTSTIFQPGTSLNLSSGMPLEAGMHQIKLCASAGEEVVCMEEEISL